MGVLTGLHSFTWVQQALLRLNQLEQGSVGIEKDDINIDTVPDDIALACWVDDHSVSRGDCDDLHFKLDVAGLSLSFLALAFVGIAILSDKRMRTHPNELIGFICLSDAYNYYQILSRYIYCGYSLFPYLDKILSYSFLQPWYWLRFNVFGDEEIFGLNQEQIWLALERRERLPGSTRVLLGSWYFLSVFVSYISLFLSTSIIMDLYFVLKNPFSSSEARVKRMTSASVFFAFLLSSSCLMLTLARNPDWSELNNVLFLVISVINIFLGIVIMIFVMITFRTKGMSKEIKKSI